MRIPGYKEKIPDSVLGVEAGLWLTFTSASSHVAMHQQVQSTLAGYTSQLVQVAWGSFTQDRQRGRQMNRKTDSFLPPPPKDNACMVMVAISGVIIIISSIIFSYSGKLIASNANT